MSSERQGVRVWLSLPDRKLHPNGRCKQIKYLAKLKKDRRETAKLCTLSALHGSQVATAPFYAVSMEVYASPQGAGRMDRDNLIAWFKSDFDGIADALELDDVQFRAPEVRIDKEPDKARRGAWIEVWAVQGEEA